jgi:succinate dehydrogenase hydrophobic anchor subunit
LPATARRPDESNQAGYHASAFMQFNPRKTPLEDLSPMLTKLMIVALIVAILYALFSGMVYLVKDPSSERRTVRALTWRVGLQVLLIVFLIVAYFMGWIQPHGLMPTP